ncbi:hypothetical protein M885DRAFT_537639 [Pelagophyceae sp. CCMP2097]|nr:hypothetical protein M885DRAFT_537639 [Pelagophyceae sp. CCMP2097]
MHDVACFVIDEASFSGVDLLDRTCHAVAQLEGLENIHVGGIPMILTGDCFQKDPRAAEPSYKTLVNDAVNDQGGSKDPTSATARGLRLLKRSRKFELTRIMRAMSDPGFIAHQSQMRDTSIAKPVNKALVKNVARPVTQADIANDATWLLAPLGVLSQLERDHMNERRLHQWCRIFGLPLVRWRIPLDTPVALQNVPTDKLYAEEVNLWCYYARGAPCMMHENHSSTRGLVNGAPGLMDSLHFGTDPPPQAADVIAAERAGHYRVITLDSPPHAVMITVGSSKAKPRHWHGVKLPDLGAKLVALDGNGNAAGDDQVVPILVSSQARELKLTGMTAAMHGLPAYLFGRTFAYNLAFALTDFKLQGRTLQKLIINLPSRGVPTMTLKSWYVLVSRATIEEGLRALQIDKGEIAKLLNLKHDPSLAAWEQGYDALGYWDEGLCRAAVARIEAAQNRTSKTPRRGAVAPAPRRGKRKRQE